MHHGLGAGYRAIMEKTASELTQRFERELDAVMAFWLRHSHDTEHGGFFTCLSESGEVYDTTKFCWLQGRQVWMYAKLYNTLPAYRTAEVLQAAERGAQFMIDHVRMPGQARCYFSVTADGKPAKMQRKPYTESFYVIAMAELHRATGKQEYKVQAEEMLTQLIHWIRVDDSELGLPTLAGAPPVSELARPMVLLNTLCEFCGPEEGERERFRAERDWCVQEILKHRQGQWVLENVSPDGSALTGSHGRLTNPGHAIEAGWFLLQEAQSGDEGLSSTAIQHFILAPYSYGWDKENGGLFYFMDCDGHPPVQLEWAMKLWWVHCEALVALLMAFRASGDHVLWSQFTQLTEYTFSKFRDSQRGGEWYGYLTREGAINQSLKGGPYKGCFHVPRCLLMCLQILGELAANQTA